MTIHFRIGAGLVLMTASAGAWAACDVSAQGVAFGNYDPLEAAPLDGVGNVHLTCTPMASVTISLSPGHGTFAQRRMNGGAAQLGYNLYGDASRTFVWGEGAASMSSAAVLDLDLPVYGRIPALQNVPANIYLDAIVVTITY